MPEVYTEKVLAQELQQTIQTAKDMGRRVLAVAPLVMKFQGIGSQRTATVLEYMLVTQ